MDINGAVSPRECVEFLKSKNYINPSNLVCLQFILEKIGCKDLFTKCFEYAKETKALCYHIIPQGNYFFIYLFILFYFFFRRLNIVSSIINIKRVFQRRITFAVWNNRQILRNHYNSGPVFMGCWNFTDLSGRNFAYFLMPTKGTMFL